MDLHPVCVLGVVYILFDQLDIVIPHRYMLIPLAAFDAVRVKAQDIDRVRPVGDHAEESKPVSGRAADRPDRGGLPNRLKCRVRLCDRLECFQLLQFSKHRFF